MSAFANVSISLVTDRLWKM